ncbi:MAG: 2-oxo acid dehydrogenase subunit E2, partial [Chitinophagales bacterium]|nr:2-oxo acid dehydrogenase subunit E2 [Chitinophagales bacterium]
MGIYSLLMPKMGESVIEATILSWKKNVGDKINENDIILEVATDKVDSEVPCPVSGIIKELLFKENDVAAIGAVLAYIEVEGYENDVPKIELENKESKPVEKEEITQELISEKVVETIVSPSEPVVEIVPPAEVLSKIDYVEIESKKDNQENDHYFTPLVLNIAKTEGISLTELDKINGSGMGGRVTKEDILAYVANRKTNKIETKPTNIQSTTSTDLSIAQNMAGNGNEIIEMDRMRKLIAKNMLDSRKTSPHVSSFVEVDVTNIVKWREKNKDSFLKKEGIKLTFMPVIIEAIVKAIKDFPLINVSVVGDTIVKKKEINISFATALPNGNLIVPVIKNADRKSVVGLATELQSLAEKARKNALTQSDIEGGTYTISNMGTFGNIMGTGIINQPQVAIMVVGSVTKKPVVLETPDGDVIAIRHMMYLSHTYDHRVVDGMLGGKFCKRVAEYLEAFEVDR